MTYISHMALGGASAVAVLYATKEVMDFDSVMGWVSAGVFFLSSLIGSLFPDIDSRDSKISRMIGGINEPITRIVEHRGFFHSAYFVFLMFVAHFVFSHFFHFYASEGPMQFLFLGFIFGYFTHQFFDAFTMGGVRKWFFGQNLRFLSPNIPIIKRFAFKTGESAEFFCVLVLLFLILFYPIWFEIISWGIDFIKSAIIKKTTSMGE